MLKKYCFFKNRSSFARQVAKMSLTAVLGAGLLLGCPTGDGNSSIPTPEADAGGEMTTPPENSDFFTDVQVKNLIEVLPQNGSGLAVGLRSNGDWAVGFVGSAEGTFQCDTFGGGTVLGGDNRSVMLATPKADGSVALTMIDAIPSAAKNSMDMLVDQNDEVVFAYAGGETANGYCGPSDLMLAREGGTPQTIATDSATSNGCLSDENGPETICQIGDTVGHYAALAEDADGTLAIVFQDIHNGFAETDFSRSDLELARGSGALAVSSILPGTGAGTYGAVAFGPEGRIIAGTQIVANNSFRDDQNEPYTITEGLYVVVEKADGSFFFHNVAETATNSRVTVGYHPAVGFAAAYHDAISDRLIYVEIADDSEATPVLQPVAQIGLTGRSPSLGFLSDGTPVLAYRHCAGAGANTCKVEDDGVRVSVRVDGVWRTQSLPNDDEDFEGLDVDMVIGADDTVAIVSQNTSRGYAVLNLLKR